MNNLIYVPDYESTNCAYMYSNNVLRVYDEQPRYNSTITYTDYMVDNHYLYRNGSTTFSNYSTLPVCLDSSSLTTNMYYRTDFDNILVIFFILFIFIVYIPIKLFSRLFGRWFKL